MAQQESQHDGEEGREASDPPRPDEHHEDRLRLAQVVATSADAVVRLAEVIVSLIR